MMDDLNVGDYIIFVTSDKYEIGRIKELRSYGAVVSYHDGETGALTNYDDIHKLSNAYTIIKTSLGGYFFNKDAKEEIESLTEPEQRIFLAAMVREKKVCMQEDAQWNSEVSLVRICRSIERKVKKALFK